MLWLKLEDIKEITENNGMLFEYEESSVADFIEVYLNKHLQIAIFKSAFKGVDQFELLSIYTNVIKSAKYTFGIEVTGFVSGERFFGDLNMVFGNMMKKYRKLCKRHKMAEIKAAGGEYDA